MSGRLRVTYDREIFWAQRRGGVSRYFVELAQAFSAHPELGVDGRLPVGMSINEHLNAVDPDRHPLVRRVPGVFPLRPLANRALRMAGRRAPAGWERSDVVHHTLFAPEIVARTPGAVRVFTVHDMINSLMPELTQADVQARRMRQAVQAADAIICVSHATRDDLMRVWGDLVRAPVTVIHHGVGPEFSPLGRRLVVDRPYLMHVGTRTGYKDFDTSLRACASPSLRREGIGLLCVGGGPFTAEEHRRISGLGLGDVVEQRDLPGPDVQAAYRGALAYVCPSRYEGFGLPVLEALASGCPVVLADTPALREVGGDAVLSFPPGDAEALLTCLLTIIEASEEEAATTWRKGRARAERFTWGATARATASVYATAVGAGEGDA